MHCCLRAMPAPYSEDLRWRVIWFVLHMCHTTEETAFYLGVSEWTVQRYVRKFLSTGSINANPLGRPFGSVKFVPREELIILKAVLKSPEKTLAEILDDVYGETGSTFSCSTLHYHFKRNGITRKEVSYVLFRFGTDLAHRFSRTLGFLLFFFLFIYFFVTSS